MDLKPIRRNLAAMAAALYLVGSYKGYLALWKENEPEPCRIFPVAEDTLREDQRQALARGIPARSPRELAEILEAFLPG